MKGRNCALFSKAFAVKEKAALESAVNATDTRAAKLKKVTSKKIIKMASNASC